jgi:hypothetical protein
MQSSLQSWDPINPLLFEVWAQQVNNLHSSSPPVWILRLGQQLNKLKCAVQGFQPFAKLDTGQGRS